MLQPPYGPAGICLEFSAIVKVCRNACEFSGLTLEATASMGNQSKHHIVTVSGIAILQNGWTTFISATGGLGHFSPSTKCIGSGSYTQRFLTLIL
ncbi:hypothetical protein PsorP6_015886 [Peronosclerospora sorghi]|uniref:Uncharacterized protein n=1 Tax=Peronosclerospora sorghi TaxID=230839 RepID=A0ACC0WPK0_9STRA|nr:hypothetical protein PsorP6_015886 [Peronosclerospora sorghi]